MSIGKAFFFAAAMAGSAPAFAQDPPSERPARTAVIPMYDASGIRAWADCAWEKLPVSSSNLVDYQSSELEAPDNDGIPFASGEEALNYRINSVCASLLSPRDRNAISPMVKRAKQRILNEARPTEMAVEEADVKSYVCAMKVDDRYVRTEFDLQTPTPRRLPPSQSTCFSIQSDGSLLNA